MAGWHKKCSFLFLSILVASSTSWVSAQEPPTDWLTAEEQAWLDSNSVLRHGVILNHEPFEFVDEHGVYNGLTSDYVAILAERLGVVIQEVHVESFAELAAGMVDGSIDIATYLPRYDVVSDALAWSEPVIQMPIAAFGRQDSALLLDVAALAQWRVAVEKPSRAQEIFSRDWPDLEFVYVESPEQGLTAVVNGEADYFVHNVFSVEYYQRRIGIEPVKSALQLPYTFDIRVSVRPDLEPLVPLIHKTINSLSNHERTLIFDKWVNLRPSAAIDWKRVLVVGGAILVFVLSLFLWILFWNRRLTRRVAARTSELEESHQAMRALAMHMDRIREEEKSRIAIEMHDELGHTLTALTMGLRRFGSVLRKKYGEVEVTGNQVSDLVQLVREATKTSRRIMSDLRPSVLNDLGLVAAIEWLAHEFESHYGIGCLVDAEDLDIDLPEGALIALFRITQESLTNVAKHADATSARVSLRIEDSVLFLDIADDGVGMSAEGTNSGGSFGLMGMGERALALGGQLSVDQESTGGTRVSVRVPISEMLNAPSLSTLNSMS